MNSIPKLSPPEEASAEGLEFIQPKLNEMQAAILALLKARGFHGATDSEIAHELCIGDNARKRRGELCKDGYVVPLDVKRPAANGYGMPTGPTRQTVWVAREYALHHKHTSKDVTRVEERISALIAAARRLKRILRKDDLNPDELYSRHTAVSDAFSNYTTNFHLAWEGLKMIVCPDCEGEGSIECFADRMSPGTDTHTTDHWSESCERCGGEGEIDREEDR